MTAAELLYEAGMNEKPQTLKEALRDLEQPAKQRLPGQGPAPAFDPDTLAGTLTRHNEESTDHHEHRS